jgi:hypothetical protein
MRFEIKINQRSEDEMPVLVVLLFTRKDEEYLNGCEDGIYNCASTLPDDRKALLSIVEQSANACLEEYNADIKEKIDNFIKKYQPTLDDLVR